MQKRRDVEVFLDSVRELVEGLVEPKLSAKDIPNLADVYDYAVSDKICGVSAFTSAIGFGPWGIRVSVGPSRVAAIAAPKAIVLPDPVWEETSRSRPAQSAARTAAWTEVGVS